MESSFISKENFEVHIDINQKQIHLFDQGNKNRNHHKLKKVMTDIAELRNINKNLYNWIYYGQGKAFAISQVIYTPLSSCDPRLYPLFRGRMFVAAPFRNL